MIDIFSLKAPFRLINHTLRGGIVSLEAKVRALFANGEVGAWYDPSDLTTMFQDRIGSIPVTADGQTVGLILDKSKGLVLGPVLNSNSSFDSGMTSWGGMANGTVDTSVSGQVTVSQTSTGATTFSNQAVTTVVGKTYKCTFVAQGVSGGVELFIGVWDGSAKVGLPDVVTGSPQTVSLIFTASTTNPELRFGLSAYNSAGAVVTYYSATIQELPGNHAVAPSDAARPLYKTDGTYHWLQFDGVDDSLSTTAIDFTATDKMSVFAGVRKLNNVASVIVETSADTFSNAGSFLLQPAQGGGANYAFYGKGSTFAGRTATSFASPISNVVSVVYDISQAAESNEIVPRINAVTPTLESSAGSTGAMGSGSFGNYPMFICCRNGATLPFNGRIYSIIVRGALSTTDEITATETWVAAKTGVTL